MRPRRRILLVVVESPPRPARLASTAAVGLPSLDVARLTAQLLRLGAEVRVMDQGAERISPRTVRREARWWRPSLTLLHAGGEALDDDPLPDASGLRELLAGWGAGGRVLATGPLAARYGAELLERFARLDGWLSGSPTPALLEGEPLEAPGAGTREGVVPAAPEPDDPRLRRPPPAWQALPLEAYPGRGPGQARALRVAADGADHDADLAEVRHAVLRGGARFLQFETRDVAAHAEGFERLARVMFGAAPGVPWGCRLRADRVEPAFVLALARGGCQEVLLVSADGPDAEGHAPMDDPHRGRLEAAVETLAATGLAVSVGFVVGRPGHDRGMLDAWQRWFADRRIAVRPQVRVLHAGARGPGAPRLDAAHERAGCWDNALRPSDVERAVRALGGPLAPVLAGWGA